MTESVGERLADQRRAARVAAAVELERLGFQARGDDWCGSVGSGDAQRMIKVRLPSKFPDQLPELFLLHPPDHPVPHVDRAGKICFAPEHGTLVDADRPEQILADALRRAEDVLSARDYQEDADEVSREFAAYWRDESELRLHSILRPDQPSGVVTLTHTSADGRRALLAESRSHAVEWCTAVDWPVVSTRSAYLVRTHRTPAPPMGDRFTLRDLLALVTKSTPHDEEAALRAWLEAEVLPAVIAISAPLSGDHGNVLVGALVPELKGDAAVEARRGFRPGNEPTRQRTRRALTEAVTRLEVHRLDPAYTLKRGGADQRLQEKHVCLIGCGSVGSETARLLLSSGVGKLTLVDHEQLDTANIYRHALGASDVGKSKALQLAQDLQKRFPNVTVTPLNERVEDVLEDREEQVVATDLVVIAVGDETLERRLNEVLWPLADRVHVWLEPLGLGGHVLWLRRSGRGCLACLYHQDRQEGLVNMASLVEPGQDFQRTFAGCGGTFTPYGAGDAQQAAIHAVRLATRALVDSPPSVLLSWVSDKDPLDRAGFRLARRCSTVEKIGVTRKLDFSSPSCSVCGSGKP